MYLKIFQVYTRICEKEDLWEICFAEVGMKALTVHIQNVVVSASFQQKFDLLTIAKAFRNIEYRPNVFPGLVFRCMHAYMGKSNIPSITVSIVNVVATASLGCLIDLESLRELFPHEVVHDPEIYRGIAAYFKSDKMQGKVSIFSSGKMISVGTRSVEKAHYELALVASHLEDAGIAKLKGPAKIVNIVATADLGFDPKLDSIGHVEDVQIIYEPDQFPGAIIRFALPEKQKATILLFSSGKIVCVGLRNRKDVDSAIHHLLKIIS